MRFAVIATFFHGVGAGGAGPAPKKCSDLKRIFEKEKCCSGGDSQALPSNYFPPCVYNFAGPDCAVAGPQTPKDLTKERLNDGNRYPAAPTMDRAQMNDMALVNVHFHLGSEHKSDYYNNDVMTRSGQMFEPYVNRVGWWGKNTPRDFVTKRGNATKVEAPCEGLRVGDTIEVHWVHSSAGRASKQTAQAQTPNITDESLLLTDGLGYAANGRSLLNPMVHVEATVYSIVKDGDIAFSPGLGGLFEMHMPVPVNEDDYIRYVGSSTGSKYSGDKATDGQKCSPYVINWGVDRRLHNVTATDMKNLCAKLKASGIKGDLKPHASRTLVHKLFVSPRYELNVGGTRASRYSNMKQ